MRLLRLKEVSELYGIPMDSLYRAARSSPADPHHLPHVRLGAGGTIWTREDWVEEWLTRMRSDAGIPRRRWSSAKDLQAEIKRLEQRLGGE
ncbi:AlpA family transcriptional regulator [Thermus sp. NEB1569]|uniref:helix-turn-helix transcriptional regulator n=1 Tax=Thermus sp. NEB1569 TaxID=2918899 RepID=UPI001EFBD8E2|nr:helix-turn-helix domain-containing protein [Thermus sp. NEB1569]ULR41226.1 helix-turn-helix domain-containing protein [Thermus sp. NEB1569]